MGKLLDEAGLAEYTTKVKSYTYSKAESDARFAPLAPEVAKRYIARWDKTTNHMTRMGDAENITTNTTNFTHNGSLNPNYYNPFDMIEPWSKIKLCNINYPAYYAGISKIEDAVLHWEGDADFDWDDEWGVWVYVPEFWGKSWEDATYRYFAVSDKEYDNTYKRYPARIYGRNKGVKVTRNIGGTNKTVFLPIEGMPCTNEAMSNMHTYANNALMTLDNIYGLDGITLLYLVEFANTNSQTKLGNGVSSLYRQNAADLIVEGGTDVNYVIVNATIAGYCDVGAILNIGTTSGGNQIGSFIVKSKEASGSNFKITLDRTVTTTTAHFTSVHGRSMMNDEQIGSMSGYIGTNGRCDAYYRGQVLFGNMFIYILGAYRDAQNVGGTCDIWFCPDDNSCDNYNKLDKTVHVNTGASIPSTEGYIKSLAYLDDFGQLPICAEIGGSSTAPVGDYLYNSNLTSTDRILILGGSASPGTYDGLFYGHWANGAGISFWNYSARPNLKNP